MTAFEEFGVLPEISKAIEDIGWTLPTDVQAEAIPLILGGGDVLMAAEAGSGKTGAICLPVLQITWESLKDLQGKTAKKGSAPSEPSDDGWKMSVQDRGEAVAVAPDGLRVQSRHQAQWHGCRAVKGVANKGMYYYEASVSDEGLGRVGFSTLSASLNLGTCPYGYGFGGTGKKSNYRQFDNYGEAFGKGDTIGCYLDLDNHEISFTKNGRNLGLAFAIPKYQMNQTFFPAVVLKNAEVIFNFGNLPFKFPPTVDGFVGFSNAYEKNVMPNTKGGQAHECKIVNNAPQALIIEPSRELAQQTCDQIRLFKKHLGAPNVRELLVVGGVKKKRSLAAGVDIVVATPSRLEDLINNQSLSLNQCRFFILDEADALLKSGYGSLIKRLHRRIPKMTSDGTRLQMIVCSATLHDFEVKKLADQLMHFPLWVDLKGEDSVPETVHHVIVTVDPKVDQSWASLKKAITTDGVHAKDKIGVQFENEETWSEAVKLLKGEYCIRAIRQLNMDHGLIFCQTKLDCDNLKSFFNAVDKEEFSSVCLHGHRRAQERKKDLELFKAKKVKFLICTDVAARGLDVKGLPFMINMTLPDDKSTYLHRIGRVGRAERMGLAISFIACHPEKVWFHGEWCKSQGRNCFNTTLTDFGGCCIMYNEKKLLGDIEQHLGVTIQQISTNMKVEANEFDGKVIYGEKKKENAVTYEGHAKQLKKSLEKVTNLETDAQKLFLATFYG